MGLEETDKSTPSVFYARQLPLPLLVSVYEMLECHGMNIVPISSLAVNGMANGDDILSKEAEWRALLARPDRSDWCILTLDVRNTYGLAFEVQIACGAGAPFYISSVWRPLTLRGISYCVSSYPPWVDISVRKMR